MLLTTWLLDNFHSRLKEKQTLVVGCRESLLTGSTCNVVRIIMTSFFELFDTLPEKKPGQHVRKRKDVFIVLLAEIYTVFAVIKEK